MVGLVGRSSDDTKKFTIPQLNFEAREYCELVKWIDFHRLQPLITCKLTDNDIDETMKTAY